MVCNVPGGTLQPHGGDGFVCVFLSFSDFTIA